MNITQTQFYKMLKTSDTVVTNYGTVSQKSFNTAEDCHIAVQVSYSSIYDTSSFELNKCCRAKIEENKISVKDTCGDTVEFEFFKLVKLAIDM